jgi:arylsulfatase A-like enzyme
VWEGGIRIPFMMRWTDHITRAQVIDQPVVSLDIFPTALAAAGISPRKKLKLDGVNLLPWLTSKQSKSPHDILYWRFKPAWAVREGNYKLVFALGEIKSQLFDLTKDPGETTDLSAQQPQVVQEMQKKFDTWNAQLMEPRWPGRQEGAHEGKPIVLGIPGISGVMDD